MLIERTWIRRSIVWCLAYLWSAAAALAINHAAGWQYDGDIGWWAVTAYAFPALAIASPLLGIPGFGAVLCLGILLVLTVSGFFALRR